MVARRGTVFALTFVVAFCSIAYELVYSELLTVVFGGTVLRYSVTIGLYLFALGVGAFCFRFLDDHPSNFFRLEVYLALAGPFGVVFIIGLNALVTVDGVPLVLSHLPILVVGFLSGLEIPFLAALAGDGEDSAFGRLGAASRRVARGALGVLFATTDTEVDDGFSEVLGMDYLGSLAGTVVYALVLYPRLGLIPAAIVLGLLNAVAALVFYAGYRGSVRVEFGRPARALLVVCLLTTASYGGALVADVERPLTNVYTENAIEREYPSGNVEVDIAERHTTRYQDVLLYERTWTGPPERWEAPTTETCLRLDMHLQLCESWVDSYHDALVDVPATLYDDLAGKRVLLVGGGDHIAVNELREHGATVHRVDIDREFMAYARDHPFFEQYHDDAYRYENLTTTVGDAYGHLRGSDETYHLVLLDLPGIRNDDLLRLYSTEFYAQLRTHLRPGGVVATWSYSRYAFPQHYEAYMATVRAAGFESYLSYTAYDDLDGDGDPERAEGFYVFSPGATPRPDLDDSESAYVREYRDRYADMTWRPVPDYPVQPNSVFDPNYDVIVDYDT